MIATLLIFGAALIRYVFYVQRAITGPRGGSVPGLLYGIAGYGMMIFAALLGARKKVPVWRIGRAQTWMRGHLWLGLLSLPFILFHAGFAAKGPLTFLLMVLLFTVVISGVAGAALQHYMPRVMTREVPMETIFDEIPHVREQLCEEADTLVAQVCGVPSPAERADTTPNLQPLDEQVIVEIEPENRAKFREIYDGVVRPYLTAKDRARMRSDRDHFAPIFKSMRTLVPPSVHHVVGDLESICEEERQLARQGHLYRWLHGWLLVHVPISIALIVLGGVHAVLALRY